MGKKVVVSAQVDEQIALCLDMIAKIERRRRSDIIRRAIEKYLLTSGYSQRSDKLAEKGAKQTLTEE